MALNSFLKILTISLLLTACNSEPKVIESVSSSSGKSAVDKAISNSPDVSPVEASGNHKVTVKEILDTDKYTYMAVEEDGEEFWVAVTKRPIEVGATYYFQNGLLKKNFFSKEYNRVFETLYLVGDLRQQPKGAPASGGSAVDQALSQLQESAVEPPTNITPAEGAIQLSELFSDMEKYNGKTVTVTGKIVKVNPMIMGRNWLHLQDGSGDGLDLTVTSEQNIPIGHVVTLEGVIALDKDFGAGYRYDIIMEGAVIK
jgi:starvation-inducible outer membrane lipoprotein